MKTLIATAAILTSVCGFFMSFAYGWERQDYRFIVGGLVLIAAPWIIAKCCGKSKDLGDIIFPDLKEDDM